MRLTRSSLLLAAIVAAGLLAGIRPAAAAQSDPTPLLAYYYIWFDPGSWERAKRDLPLLGRYSSDDADVMRQHIQWAQAAGIDGFIVSWKSTEALDRRLQTLVEVAESESFWLAIIYQGLDFERRPQPIETIRADLAAFVDVYGERPAFQLFGRPLIIWSGTWEYADEDIAAVAADRGQDYYLLASAQQIDEYLAIASLVDGNAYYWSSVDPENTGGYETKLQQMGEAVHDHGGLWIAPAAPGFDARLIGGARVIERRNGETLRQELSAAARSSPDAIGLISWNEFSENSHVEPSLNFGGQSLEVLAELRGGALPEFPDFDSSEPADTLPPPNLGRLAPLAFLGLVLGASVLMLLARRGRTSERARD